MQVKEGSRWSGNEGTQFHVLSVVELEGHTWVHYIKDNTREDTTREYSCYIESFLSRFNPIPE